jgi:hypothetical protein
MRVLVACEESQEVCKAFRALGHEAYSCDLQECSGGHPEWHFQMDVLTVLKGGAFITEAGTLIEMGEWDLMIAFPPCTDLTCMNASHWKIKQADGRQPRAIAFVDALYNCDIPKVSIENPVGALNTKWKKPTQIIHPFHFGDPYMKRTCLWLKGLPALQYKRNLFFDRDTVVRPVAHWVVNHKVSKHWGNNIGNKTKLPELNKNSKKISKTFPGIARAMAEQWGGNLNQKVA